MFVKNQVMKKVFLFAVIGLASCSKHKFEKRIQGTWTMKEARLESSNSWQSFPSTEPPVTITETHVSNPWNTTYIIVDETIVLNNQFVKVEVKKNDMLWVFENTDSLRFTR